MSNALEIYHNGLFSPKPRLTIRSPGISPGSVGTTKAVNQIKLSSIYILKGCEGFSEAQHRAQSPLTTPQKTAEGSEKRRRSLDSTHIPAVQKKAVCALVSTDRSDHTPGEQHTCTRTPTVFPQAVTTDPLQRGGQTNAPAVRKGLRELGLFNLEEEGFGVT